LEKVDRGFGLPQVQQGNGHLPMKNRHERLEVLHFLPDGEFLFDVAQKPKQSRGILRQRVGIIGIQRKRTVVFFTPGFPIMPIDCILGQCGMRSGIVRIQPQRLVRRIVGLCRIAAKMDRRLLD